MPGLRSAIADQVRTQVRAALAPRRRWLAPVAQDAAELHAQAAALQAGLDRLDRRLDALHEELALRNAPYTAAMTIDAAWRRHPGARRVFAAHGLPACDHCAVRFDETVAEAAQAYGLDLEGLMAQLQALVESHPGPSPGGD